MRKQYAYLSGSNRLTCVQANAICDSNERYRERYDYGLGTSDATLMGAMSRIRNSIHKGRLANLSEDNKQTVEEVWVLIRHLELLISTISYANGYEKRAIEKALPVLQKSVTINRRELRGKRHRLHKLWTRVDDEDDDLWADIPSGEPETSNQDDPSCDLF
jgi:hypothetical protein